MSSEVRNIVIEATEAEWRVAQGLASIWVEHAENKNYKNSNLFDIINPEIDLNIKTQSICAQLVVSRTLDLKLNYDENKFLGPNIGEKTIVRSSPNLDAPLIIRPRDWLRRYFVLVTGSFPLFNLVGWCWGRDVVIGRRLETRGGRGKPCWVIEQKEDVFRGWPEEKLKGKGYSFDTKIHLTGLGQPVTALDALGGRQVRQGVQVGQVQILNKTDSASSVPI